MELSGKRSGCDGGGNHAVDIVCVDKCSDFLDSDGEFIDVVAADLQCGVDEDIGDIMVGSDDTADEAVKRLTVTDRIFLCINQTNLMRDIELQFIALFETDNGTVGVVRRSVYHFDQSLGLAGTFEANNQF